MFDSSNSPNIEILDDISKCGIKPPDRIIFDGEIHRFGKKKSCWYVAYLHPTPVCVYGDWKSDLKRKYIHSKFVTPAERLQVRKAINVLETKRLENRDRQYQETKIRANKLWIKAKPVLFHEYLRRKQILPLGIRFDQHNNLLIPLTDGKDIHSIQFIQPDGTKRFLKGGKTKGMFYQIKPQPEIDKLLICEGFATGATLYMESKLPVLVAFNAGNLIPVALTARKRWPDAELIIAGDDDRGKEGNPGATKARQAAIAAGALVTLPQWPDDAPNHLTDFNDLACWLNRGCHD